MEIYHYLPLEALHSMLNSYIKEQKTNKSLTFWASSALHMNDKNEIVEVFNAIKEIVSIIEKKLLDRIIDNPSLQKYVSNVNEIVKCDCLDLLEYVEHMDFKIQKENLYKMDLLQYFVISFSNVRDFLPMWNTYGDGGIGVCLKLETDELHGIIKGYDNIRLEYHSDVIYKPEDLLLDKHKLQLEELVKIYAEYVLKKLGINNQNNIDMFQTFINETVLPVLKHHNIPNCDHLSNLKIDDTILKKLQIKETVLQSMKMHAINEMIIILSPIIKHSCFEYEKEHRMVASIKINRDIDGKIIIPQFVKYRMNKNGNIIPYIEIEIPIESIKEIILGPCANSDIIGNSLSLEMDSCGFGRIPIIPSSLPYRRY